MRWTRYYTEIVNDDDVFKEGSADNILKGNLRNGDIILFHRELWSYNPFMVVKIAFHKYGIKRGGWGHIGVVVLDVDEDDEPYVVEHAWDGIKVTPYDMRSSTARSDAMAYRNLKTELTLDQVTKLNDWLNDMREKQANGEGGTYTWRQIFRNIIWKPRSSVLLHGENENTIQDIKIIDKEASEATNNYLKQKFLQKLKMLEYKRISYKCGIREKREQVLARPKSYQAPCKLVADAWHVMGLIKDDSELDETGLPTGPMTREWLIHHFVDDVHLPFQQSCYLEAAMMIREVGKDASVKRNEDGVVKDYRDKRKMVRFVNW